MLQDVLGAMPEDEARFHLKRCVDSGLWLPNAKEAEDGKKGGEDESPESVYAAVGDEAEK